MADQQQSQRVDVLVARKNQGLIAIPGRENGEEVTYYMLETGHATAAEKHVNVERALAAAGSWSDLDPDEVLDALDRIRHSSPPSPPLDLDD